MIRHQDSHVDHDLNETQIRYLLDRFTDRQAFFIETFELPGELGTLSCALWGPIMGDPAIPEDEVIYAPRGTRKWTSRLVKRPARATRLITVIAGPHEEPCPICPEILGPTGCPENLCKGGRLKHTCVLYTAFGGPSTPQEPGDPGCKDPVTSTAFWREHALVK